MSSGGYACLKIVPADETAAATALVGVLAGAQTTAFASWKTVIERPEGCPCAQIAFIIPQTHLNSFPYPQIARVAVNGVEQTVAIYYDKPSLSNDVKQSGDASNYPSPNNSTATHQLATKRVLVVGAGGIGCELVKSLVLLGFRQLVLVDLDTIDATNLNRQFLFRKKHVGMPKAEVVAGAVTEWYDNWKAFVSKDEGSAAPHPLKITPICGNIKNADGPFDLDFFKSFDVVLNGLDNVSARQHVNRMCMQAETQLVESGTAGYNGQVQPIVRRTTACYDCVARPPDKKSFAVCTIHARPTQMIHCVHYAKELYERLFGANSVQQEKQSSGPTGAAPPQESDEMAFLSSIASSGALTTAKGTGQLLSLLYVSKIEELLSMKASTTWSTKPPIALRSEIIQGSSRDDDDNPTKVAVPADDFKVPSIAEVVALAREAIPAAAQRLHREQQSGTQQRSGFKKEDPIAVKFVAAMANLRASCFHIERDSLHELTSIAGSIVPAIATTNAIIASGVANIAKLMMTQKGGDEAQTQPLPFIYVRKAPQTRRRKIQMISDGSAQPKTVVAKDELLLLTAPPPPPNPKCLICSDNAARAVACCLNPSLYTLGDFVKVVLRDRLSLVAPTVGLGASILYEHDEFEGLASQPLTRWVGGRNDPKESEKSASSTHAPPPSSVTLDIGDLYQTVEWRMTIVPQWEGAPHYRSDKLHFSVDGTEATSEEERMMASTSVGVKSATNFGSEVCASMGEKSGAFVPVDTAAPVVGEKRSRNGSALAASTAEEKQLNKLAIGSHSDTKVGGEDDAVIELD